MSKNPKWRVVLSLGFASMLLAAFAFISPSPAHGGVINLSTFQGAVATIPGHGQPHGTNMSGLGWTWNYTGNFSNPRFPVFNGSLAYDPPLTFIENLFCIGPGGDCQSNNNDGVAGNEYAGFEFIYFEFALPAGGSNAALSFARLSADDRAVVLLNGTRIAAFGGSGGVATVTTHAGLGPQSIPFSGSNGVGLTVTDQSLFNFGGDNVLTFWLNNTFSSSLTAAAQAHAAQLPVCCDPSALDAVARVTFDDPSTQVPAPPSAVLLGLGIVLLAALRRRCAA